MLLLSFILKFSLDEPVQKTLMNVKKTLSSPEDTKQQTNEQKRLQSEWFLSPDHMKVRKQQPGRFRCFFV